MHLFYLCLLRQWAECMICCGLLDEAEALRGFFQQCWKVIVSTFPSFLTFKLQRKSFFFLSLSASYGTYIYIFNSFFLNISLHNFFIKAVLIKLTLLRGTLQFMHTLEAFTFCRSLAHKHTCTHPLYCLR